MGSLFSFPVYKIAYWNFKEMLYVDQHGSFFNVVDENPIGLDVNCTSIQGYLLN